MATPEAQSAAPFAFNSHATALCIIPPEHCWVPIDRLRSLYDKAYRKWPPHVNLVYPFVQPERLEVASQHIQTYLRSKSPSPLDVSLDTVGVFSHRHDKTLFLRDGRDDESEPLLQLRAGLVAALSGRADGSDENNKSFRMHMTVAQSSGSTPFTSPSADVDGVEDATAPSDTHGHAHRFLLHKVGSMPPVSWQVDRLHILVRERLAKAEDSHGGREVNTPSSRMRLWGVLHLADGTIEQYGKPTPFYKQLPADSAGYTGEDVASTKDSKLELPVFQAVTYTPEDDEWIRCSDDHELYSSLPPVASPGSLSISTYNVLGEFEWPPKQDRFPLLIKNIVASNAAADVLVLQEVTDHFLSVLLGDNRVRSAYPFASHGPPSQADMDPLPSHLNMVVLSRRPFSWTWLDFERSHKGALVARFSRQGEDDSEKHGLVLATVHLTHGLTNGSVSAKRNELQRLFSHLQKEYPLSVAETVVIAGDLNIHTSSSAVHAAVRRKAISTQTAQYVETGFDDLFAENGFADAYSETRQLENDGNDDHDNETDEMKHDRRHHNSEITTYDGEEGSTYNPFTNALAARIIGSGLNTRPERFDRILVRSSLGYDDDNFSCDDEDGMGGNYTVTQYNTFGFPARNEDHTSADAYASDHWGIRCTLSQVAYNEDEEGSDGELSEDAAKTDDGGFINKHISPDVEKLIVPVEPVYAPAGPLADPAAVVSALGKLNAIPSEDDIARRKAAFDRLKAIILNEGEETEVPSATSKLPRQLVVVPVGSYGLGVWTPASDIDCLCIGAFGAQTFFALASQRLRTAANADPESSVRIIRRVRAHTGTMMELEVCGIRMDLQYCSAGLIAETWPAALVLPPTHPIFTISPHILSKLKAARDLYCLRKSFPELVPGDAGDVVEDNVCIASNFRTAHRAIKAWAQSRGLYVARFGYLGGIQIAILLVRVMKLMQREISKTADQEITTSHTVSDILVTFFQHYADFDWKTKMAFDPFFHNEKSPYTPTSREPLAILGYHRPQLNTSMAASVPSVRVLSEEFQRAARLLKSDSGLTWDQFLSGGDGSTAAGNLYSSDDIKCLPPGPGEFVKAYRSYVKLDLQYWGLSLSKGSAFVGWLESRCVLLLVDLARRLPELNARIWPGRFVEIDEDSKGKKDGIDGDEDGDEGDRQYQGCYLVGLDLPETMTRDERRTALGTLQSVLAHFEKQIRGGGDGRGNLINFDPKWQWVGINIVNRADIGDASRLRLDSRSWGEYSLGDEDSDDDEEEEENEGEDGLNGEESDSDPSTAKASKKAKANDKKNKKKLPMAVVHRPGSGAKFRMAQDVIKRLRWDPHLDWSDYIVGYEDRFLGARERPLEQWKSEQTDEEFIPQHRILYFRRRSDDVIVWDRRTRKDVIFGSGIDE